MRRLFFALCVLLAVSSNAHAIKFGNLVTIDASNWTPRGAWSSATTYAVEDVVSYEGDMYTAIAISTNQTPATVSTYWQKVVAQGPAGTDGTNGTNGAQGIQGIQGEPGPAGAGSGDMLKSENLSGLSSYATARSNLGLTISTNVQAYDADLTTYAGITPSANAQTLLGHTFAQMLSDIGAASSAHNHSGTYEPAINAAGIVAKFNSGTCSGYLKSDGLCDTPSGTSHDAVTIGTANGLSLSTQALSLAASTTTTPGAATAAQITELARLAAAIVAASDGNNKITMSNNTAASPTTATNELYFEANVFKVNQNGTESAFIYSGGALGTPSSGTLTNATGLPVAGIAASTSTALGVGSVELGHASDTTIARSSAGVVTIEGVTATRTIASGTSALGTSAIASGACATVVTTTATGAATTDVIEWGFNTRISQVTGYSGAATGSLRIDAYPTAGNANFEVCNQTASSITPGAVTLNWSIRR